MMEFETGILVYGFLLSGLFCAVTYWGITNDYGKLWQWNVLALVAGLTIFAGFEGMASQHKPFYLELWKSQRYEMLHYLAYPNHRIYILMLPQGQTTPRLYSIPWTSETEDDIVEAMRAAKERGVPPHFYYLKDHFEPHEMPKQIELEDKDNEST